jgi:preprotein translocase subunit SecE
MALDQASRTQARRRTSSSPSEQGQAGFVRYFLEIWDELRKVVWPTLPELYRYTLVVVVTVVVFAGFIGAVDYGLTEAAKRFVYGALGVAGGAGPSPSP